MERSAPKTIKANSCFLFRQLRSYSSITCAVYNHDGTEILASYSDDDIYLFKLAEAEAEMVIPTERFRGHW